uniref:Uncharacterized protein n=1 Tax=Euplotes harpa TaxID=151035 RepID=A0A7S3J4V5_9SPIT|mmetsp:Transcript_14924/g.17261  ORF Transcript_14924/g.17261 Transcript_14924/m.17261 type:complete len:133 (+) Transcript_14924:108-506(+)
MHRKGVYFHKSIKNSVNYLNKKVVNNLACVVTNSNNISNSTKDSNLSEIKTAQISSKTKQSSNRKKVTKRNAYIPNKLKTHKLEDRINSLINYQETGSKNQKNGNPNLKLFSKLKTIGIDHSRLQKTLKLYK